MGRGEVVVVNELPSLDLAMMLLWGRNTGGGGFAGGGVVAVSEAALELLRRDLTQEISNLLAEGFDMMPTEAVSRGAGRGYCAKSPSGMYCAGPILMEQGWEYAESASEPEVEILAQLSAKQSARTEKVPVVGVLTTVRPALWTCRTKVGQLRLSR